MSNSVKVVFAIVVCICMATLSHHVDGAANCDPVLTALETCRTYLQQGGTVPTTCCDGVKSLKAAASTTALRRSYCECLKSEAQALNVNAQYASSLPAKCNVDIGYPISYSVNCNTVQ